MSEEFPFIAITPRSTLTRSSSACEGPISVSNRSVQKLFIFDRPVCKQTNKQKHLKKSLLRNNSTKYVNMKYKERDSLTSKHKITLNGCLAGYFVLWHINSCAPNLVFFLYI